MATAPERFECWKCGRSVFRERPICRAGHKFCSDECESLDYALGGQAFVVL